MLYAGVEACKQTSVAADFAIWRCASPLAFPRADVTQEFTSVSMPTSSTVTVSTVTLAMAWKQIREWWVHLSVKQISPCYSFTFSGFRIQRGSYNYCRWWWCSICAKQNQKRCPFQKHNVLRFNIWHLSWVLLSGNVRICFSKWTCEWLINPDKQAQNQAAEHRGEYNTVKSSWLRTAQITFNSQLTFMHTWGWCVFLCLVRKCTSKRASCSSTDCLLLYQ